MSALIVVLLILGGNAAIMYIFKANQAEITGQILALISGAAIPPILSHGFKDKVKWKTRIYKLLHYKNKHIIAFPDSVENGIQYYSSRSRLPFSELLLRIDENMAMLALTFTIITTVHIDEIKSVLSRGKHITFLILDPNSEYVNIHKHLYIGASNLKSQIENSLIVLSDLKKDFPNNVSIKIYNHLAPLAITIIDDKIIKVEDRLVGRDANSRPSHLTYADENKQFFDQYIAEYKRVDNIATDLSSCGGSEHHQ